jgi:hypothetical protein
MLKMGREPMSKTFRKPKPVTQAQRDAARSNGAKSHGPVTEEGKAKSALNAVTHGLTSNALVLTTESRQKMDALLQAYRDEYQPQGQTENDLVEELTAAKWLQRRCWAMQTALLDITMDRMEPEIHEEFEEIDNGARTALAFLKQTDQGTALALLNRYAARHARDYHRALDKLRLIQKERREPIPSESIPSRDRKGAIPLQNHDRKGVTPIPPNEPKREQPQSNHRNFHLLAPVRNPQSQNPRESVPPCGQQNTRDSSGRESA